MSKIDPRQMHFWAHMLDGCFPSQMDESNWGSVLKDYVAKKVKNDEWYTDEKHAGMIVEPFKEHIIGMKVLCNCDNPESSQVFKFMLGKFKEWRLQKLVSIGYGAKKKAIVTPENYESGDFLVDAPGNGDMNSPDSLAEAEEADVIVSNPPFSNPGQADNLFRNFIKIAFSKNCGVVGIGMTKSIKEPWLREKILSKELFVYPCPRYTFDRAGDNLENADDELKSTVQVSIYSNWKVDMDRRPIMFNQSVSLDILPTSPVGGEKVPVSMNILDLKDSLGKPIKKNAFSKLVIPPPTQGTNGKKIIVPFSVIDDGWESSFELVDILSVVKVDVNGKTISKSPGLVLQYRDSSAKSNAQSEVTPENYELLFNKGKHEIDQLASSPDAIRRKREQLHQVEKYYRRHPNPGKDLYVKLCGELIAYLKKNYGRRQPLSLQLGKELADKAYSIGEYSAIRSKLRALRDELSKAKHYLANPEKNSQNLFQNITLQEVEVLYEYVVLLSACSLFNKKYEYFRKISKNGSKVPLRDVNRVKKDMLVRANQDIFPHLGNKLVDKNLVSEIRYKVQRVSDRNEDASTFATYKKHLNGFIEIMGSPADQFDMSSLERVSKEEAKQKFPIMRAFRYRLEKYMQNLPQTQFLDQRQKEQIMQKEEALYQKADQICKTLDKIRKQ